MKRIYISLILLYLCLPGLYCPAQTPEIILPIGHTAQVTDATFSPDGKKISTISEDRTVKIWNAENGRLILTIDGFSSFEIVSKAIFSPDGRTLMTINEAGAIRVWDSNNGRLLLIPGSKLFSIKSNESGTLNGIQYSRDGKFLFILQDSVLKMWDIRGDRLFHTFGEQRNGIRAFELGTDGRSVLTCCYDGSIVKWDVKSAGIIQSVRTEMKGNEVSVASFTPGGSNITAFTDGQYSVYDSSTGKLMTSIGEITGKGAIPDPDGTKILAVSHLYFVKNRWEKSSDVRLSLDADSERYEGIITSLYDKLSGKLLKVYIDSATIDKDNLFVGSHTSYSGFIGFSPDGKNVISVLDKCRIWDKESGKLLFSLEGQFEDFLTLKYTPDNQRILVIKMYSSDLYDAKTGKLLRSYAPPVIRRYQPEDGSLDFVRVPLAGLSPDGRSFYIVSANSTSVKLWDSVSGNLINDLTGNSAPVTEAELSANGNILITKSSYKNDMVRIWDMSHGRILQSFEGPEWKDAGYLDILNGLATVSLINHTGILKQWDAQSGKKLDTVTLRTDSIRKSIFGPDNRTMITIDSGYESKILDMQTGEVISALKGPVAEASYSPDGDKIAACSWFPYLNIWDARTGHLIDCLTDKNEIPDKDSITVDYQSFDSLGNNVPVHLFLTPGMKYNHLSDLCKRIAAGKIRNVKFSSNGLKIIETGEKDNIVKVWDSKTGALINRFEGNDAVINPAGVSILISGDYGDGEKGPKAYDLESGSLIYNLDFMPMQDLKMQYSLDGKNIVTSAWDSAKVWDATDGHLKQLLHFTGSVYYVDWKRNRFIVHDNSKLVFYDLLSGRKLFTFIAIDYADYLVVTPDNYYMGTKNAVSKLSWRVENSLYRFDQFDLQYNRPDIVLQRLGNTDSSLVRLYRNAYVKRLRKLGFTEKIFSSEWHTPEVDILNYDSLKADPETSDVTLGILGTDSKYHIDRIMIWVNGVPENGKAGLSVAGEKSDRVERNIKVKLSTGNNIIEVSCINEKGVESYKQSVEIVNNPLKSVKPDLYIISMSVSAYRDKRFDLAYAVKDGRDIAELFDRQGISGAEFNKIHIDTLFNENATKQRFMNLKEKLEKTNVDDQVIVYVSGHGLLDRKLDFYYATWDMDFQKPENKGISFDNLESILDGIPSRRKLLMMDACHSGEVDKDESEKTDSRYTGTQENIAFRGIVKEYKTKGDGVSEISSGLNLNNSFELMQELFAGLDQGTGTNVISAAGGKGFALESPIWNNGVFTYTILDGIKNLAADKNRDGRISVSELRDYSISKVLELTGGRQRPTSRRETLNSDWIIR